jgi:hypothetical protein
MARDNSRVAQAPVDHRTRAFRLFGQMGENSFSVLGDRYFRGAVSWTVVASSILRQASTLGITL